MRAARPVVAIIAVIVCAGFAVGIRQAVAVNAVTGLLESGNALTGAQERAAASDLSSARFAYPGEDVALLDAEVAYAERRFAETRAVTLGITRAEPDNLQAWNLLAMADYRLTDVRALLHARDVMVRLDPKDTHG